MAEAREVSGTNHGRAEDFSFVVSVSADPGEDIILPVHLSSETSAVSMNIRWFRGSELIYQYKSRHESTSSDYENRVSLSIQKLKRGNVSLTLRNVQESDSGEYICKVYHDGRQKTVIVNLQVRGKGQLQREIVELKRQLKKVKLDGQIKKLELEKQRVELEMERQIKKLELAKQRVELEMERQIMELEKRIEALERQINELRLPTHTLHGSSSRHGSSIHGIPPRMSDDDETDDKRGGKRCRQLPSCSSSRHGSSIHGIPPRMSDDDETDDKRGGKRCRQLPSCSSPRRRNSIHEIPPRMSDDGTSMTPETEEQRDTRDTSGVLQWKEKVVIQTQEGMDQERRQESESTEQE